MTKDERAYFLLFLKREAIKYKRELKESEGAWFMWLEPYPLDVVRRSISGCFAVGQIKIEDVVDECRALVRTPEADLASQKEVKNLKDFDIEAMYQIVNKTIENIADKNIKYIHNIFKKFDNETAKAFQDKNSQNLFTACCKFRHAMGEK